MKQGGGQRGDDCAPRVEACGSRPGAPLHARRTRARVPGLLYLRAKLAPRHFGVVLNQLRRRRSPLLARTCKEPLVLRSRCAQVLAGGVVNSSSRVRAGTATGENLCASGCVEAPAHIWRVRLPRWGARLEAAGMLHDSTACRACATGYHTVHRNALSRPVHVPRHWRRTISHRRCALGVTATSLHLRSCAVLQLPRPCHSVCQ